MGAREDMAKALNVPATDPRLDLVLQRAAEQGYDPGELVAFATGKTDVAPTPKAKDYGPDGPPEWLTPHPGRVAPALVRNANLDQDLATARAAVGPTITQQVHRAVENPLETGASAAVGAQDILSLGATGPQEQLTDAGNKVRYEQAKLRAGVGHPELVRRAEQDFKTAKYFADAAEHNPIAADVGGLAVSAFGPGGQLMKALGKAPQAATRVKRVLQSGANGFIGAGAEGGGRAFLQGKDAGQVAGDAVGSGLWGAGIGAAVGGLGELARYGHERFMDPRELSGRYMTALEQGNRSGYLTSDSFKQLPKGIAGMEYNADLQAENLGQVRAQKHAAAGARLEAAEAPIMSSREPVPVAPLHRDLNKQVWTYDASGREVRPDVGNLVENIKQNLRGPVKQRIVPRYSKPSAVLDASGAPARGPEIVGFDPGEVVMGPRASPRDVLLQRRRVREKAYGGPDNPETAPHKAIYGALAEASHTLPAPEGPALRAMDADYSASMKELGPGNELIFGKNDPHILTSTRRARRAAKATIGQSLKDTTAGGSRIRDIEKIRALGPEEAEIMDRIDAKNAYEATRGGGTRTFSHPGKWATQFLHQNEMALKTRAVPWLDETFAGRPAGLPAGGVTLYEALQRQREEERQREEARARLMLTGGH